MSNYSTPSQQEEASGNVPCDRPTKPAASESTTHEHEISSSEDQMLQEEEKIKMGDTGRYNVRGSRTGDALVAVGTHPVKGYLANAAPVEAAEGCGGDGDDLQGHGGGEEDGDSGYNTPTSPRRRIPTNLPCPPAPRKIPAKRQLRKRKAAGEHKSHHSLQRRLQLRPDELELVFFPVMEGAAAIRVKQAAGGDD